MVPGMGHTRPPPTREKHPSDKPPPDIDMKRRQLRESSKVLYREDVEPICHAISDWKLLAQALDLEESRINDYEEEAKDIGAESARRAQLARWVLLAWIQKEDLDATLG